MALCAGRIILLHFHGNLPLKRDVNLQLTNYVAIYIPRNVIMSLAMVTNLIIFVPYYSIVDA